MLYPLVNTQKTIENCYKEVINWFPHSKWWFFPLCKRWPGRATRSGTPGEFPRWVLRAGFRAPSCPRRASRRPPRCWGRTFWSWAATAGWTWKLGPWFGKRGKPEKRPDVLAKMWGKWWESDGIMGKHGENLGKFIERENPWENMGEIIRKWWECSRKMVGINDNRECDMGNCNDIVWNVMTSRW